MSNKAQNYLKKLGADEPWLFYHALAILHSPVYLSENQGALQQNWARIPLPNDCPSLEASAALGRQVSELANVENPVAGVTTGDIRDDLSSISILSGISEFSKIRWGHLTGDKTVSSDGKLVFWDEMVDVYLNEVAYWKNIPLAVWEYRMGDYQVLKKWLSYRETAILGRPLKAHETREFIDCAAHRGFNLAGKCSKR